MNSATDADGFERAITLFNAGKLGEAAIVCHTTLAAEPHHAHALHMLGIIRAEEGAVEEGLALVESALATGVVHPAIHYAHGNLLMRLGRHLEAEQAFNRSLQLDGEQAHASRLRGVALTQAGRLLEAEKCLQAALSHWPDDAAILDALGATYIAQGRYADAACVLERAIALAPDLPGTCGSLATIYEQSNRLKDATCLVEAGLKRWPAHVNLRLIQARIKRRAGDLAGAQAILGVLQSNRQLTPAVVRDIEFELGWCADGMREADVAFSHFSAAKAKSKTLAAASQELEELYPRQLRALMQLYSGPDCPITDPSPQEAAREMPVFLLGFPRSGTTLLDVMLDAHGGFAVMEEQATIQTMLDEYLAAGLSYPDDFPRLTMVHREHLRSAYIRACRQAGWDGNRQLVDKSPFATAHVGLIQQVFPTAAVIFMARHPCDVVLSCFMNNFESNSGTLHFAGLESTVNLYCGVMALWQLYVRRLPVRHAMLRYEDLVLEPEREMRRLLEFLGTAWSPQVLDHVNYALRRGRIPTPSYQQVTRPIYQHACGRWRRYQKYLEPYLPQLRPHCEFFSYDI